MSEQESRLALLAAATALMLSRGYAATTVDAICEKSGLTKGSFYHFFKTKEELGLAVLQWTLDEAVTLLSSGPYTGLKDPMERALGFVEHAEKSSGQIWAEGCLFASFALELADTNDRMQKAVSTMFQGTADHLANVFQPIVDAAGPGAPSALELAEQYIAVLEGTVILAKAHRDWTRIPKALRLYRRYLASLAAPRR